MGVIYVHDKNTFLMELLRYFIVVVFFVSAAMKIDDFFNTSYFFSNTFGFSITTAKYLLFLLISVELFLGSAITAKVTILQKIYSMTIVLLILFVFLQLVFFYKGINNCGCFGTLWKMDPLISIMKTVLLLFIIIILKRNFERKSYAS